MIIFLDSEWSEEYIILILATFISRNSPDEKCIVLTLVTQDFIFGFWVERVT